MANGIWHCNNPRVATLTQLKAAYWDVWLRLLTQAQRLLMMHEGLEGLPFFIRGDLNHYPLWHLSDGQPEMRSGAKNDACSKRETAVSHRRTEAVNQRRLYVTSLYRFFNVLLKITHQGDCIIKSSFKRILIDCGQTCCVDPVIEKYCQLKRGAEESSASHNISDKIVSLQIPPPLCAGMRSLHKPQNMSAEGE